MRALSAERRVPPAVTAPVSPGGVSRLLREAPMLESAMYSGALTVNKARGESPVNVVSADPDLLFSARQILTHHGYSCSAITPPSTALGWFAALGRIP